MKPTLTPAADTNAEHEAMRQLPMTQRSLGKEHLLNSLQMADFVSDGFLRFDELIPKDLCEQLMEELNAGLYGPYETEGAQWDEVWPEPLAAGKIFRLPAVRGIIESLVGPHPRYDHHCPHMRKGPDNGHQGLHQDAEIDPRSSGFDIQISLFPHDIGPDMGGTLFVPGSHFRKVHVSTIGRYQNVLGQVQTVCKAGTIVFWHTDLWHAGRANRTDSKRYMFKLRLNPMVRQLKLWNTDDLADPETMKQVVPILRRSQPWMGVENRIELMNRVKLWREITGDPTFDLNMYWTRTGNTPQQGYVPLPD
ncbi:MAG: phytanoyl-CoA dioxygenase family protein [Planctomycetota bacterium]